MKARALIYIERANAFWSVKFMPRDGKHMHGGFAHPDWNFSGSLDRVGVK